MRTTCGGRILADHVPARNAPIVDRLEAAGAVLVGKTNLLEFAYGIVHPDVGPTWNPWAPDRTAGGSSGGSAAAVAAGLCYAAVGTDTGGSIRIPAAYCGVAGLKPTYGLVSTQGIFPLSWSLDHAGPIARTSADAALLLQVLLGEETAPVAPADLHGLRLVVLANHREGKEMEPAVLAAFDAACRDLADAGAVLQEVTIPDLHLADDALFPVLGPEASAIHSRWLQERPQDYAPFTRLQLELGLAVPALAHVRGQQYRRYLAGQLLAILQNADAILSPTAPWVAPHEDPAIADEAGAGGGTAHGAVQPQRAAGPDGQLRLWPRRPADRAADRRPAGREIGRSWPSALPLKPCAPTSTAARRCPQSPRSKPWPKVCLSICRPMRAATWRNWWRLPPSPA